MQDAAKKTETFLRANDLAYGREMWLLACLRWASNALTSTWANTPVPWIAVHSFRNADWIKRLKSGEFGKRSHRPSSGPYLQEFRHNYSGQRTQWEDALVHTIGSDWVGKDSNQDGWFKFIPEAMFRQNNNTYKWLRSTHTYSQLLLHSS